MSLWVAFIVAVGVALFLFKSRRNYNLLPQLPAASGDAAPDLTVIIPARNEEATIAGAVRSFPSVRVVVIDDASEDNTRYAAQSAGAEVYKAPPLDPCVLGKPNACRAGAAVAESEWLLFVDADTRYAPHFAASIVQYAEAGQFDVVTAFLRVETVTPWEKLLLPYAFALYFTGVSAVNVNSPNSKESLANGQCILFRRARYQAIGGHAAVARSVIEDVALASLAKSKKLKLRVVRAETMGAVRMYDSFNAIRRGFEKNSYRFLTANALTGLQVIAASVLLTSYLPVLIWLIFGSYYPAAVVFSLIPTLTLLPWYRYPQYSLAAPAAIYAFQAIALSGMIRVFTGVKTPWKGRDV